jgi:hypothetical protein
LLKILRARTKAVVRLFRAKPVMAVSIFEFREKVNRKIAAIQLQPHRKVQLACLDRRARRVHKAPLVPRAELKY